MTGKLRCSLRFSTKLALLPLFPLFPLLPLLLFQGCDDSERIVIGSKNFTESVLLGEILAQHLENRGLEVDRRLNLGGSFICHNALLAGQLDIYVEYTGTAYAAILELEGETDPSRVAATVDSVYAERWELIWSEPLGFNNTFAMLIRGEMARRLRLQSVSEAIPHMGTWRFGAGYEFIERADGYRGFLEHYGVGFAGAPTELELGLTYRALAEGTVDIIAGNSTDGQIDALDLYHLEDDLHYFPPYEAIPVVRQETLERFPLVREALRDLGGTIDEAAMRRMNRMVDVDKLTVSEVAEEFLNSLAASSPRG